MQTTKSQHAEELTMLALLHKMSFTITDGYWIHSLNNEEDDSSNTVFSSLAIRESTITSEKITM